MVLGNCKEAWQEGTVPDLIVHLRKDDYDSRKDFLGRRDGNFYSSQFKQKTSKNPTYVQYLGDYGFKF